MSRTDIAVLALDPNPATSNGVPVTRKVPPPDMKTKLVVASANIPPLVTAPLTVSVLPAGICGTWKTVRPLLVKAREPIVPGKPASTMLLMVVELALAPANPKTTLSAAAGGVLPPVVVQLPAVDQFKSGEAAPVQTVTPAAPAN